MQGPDYVLYAVYCAMSLSFSLVAVIIFFSSRNNFFLSKRDSILLTVFPALFWSLIVFLFLYKLGPVRFQFFTETKIVNNSPQIAMVVSFVWFLFEYFGNTINIEEKTAGVVSFAGKRTGQSEQEGFAHVPGILPLFFQVTVFIFLRFSTFWAVVRAFNVSPIIFVENIIAYTSDQQAIVLRLNCKFKISDPYAFDDAVDDNAKDEEGKRAPVINSVKEFIAKIINSVAMKNTLDDLRDDWKDSLTDAVRRAGNELIDGLQMDRVSFRFISFDNDALQKTFQSFAGRNLRRGDVGAKGEEILAILRSLKEVDPSYEKSDAERLWETFTKDERGAYGVKFF